jgi:hypothetical protein
MVLGGEKKSPTKKKKPFCLEIFLPIAGEIEKEKKEKN